MPSYLTAGKIKEGMSGTISGEPREEKHDFQDGKGEKTLFRVPIQLDTPILDDYSSEQTADWIWNPGFFARNFLEKELGDDQETGGAADDYQHWINVHGSFHPRAWSSKTRNGFAWHFIPDNQQIPVPPEAEEVEKKQLKDFPKQVPSSGATTTISCSYCNEAGDSWSTSKPENMLAHLQKFHPDKLPKEGTISAKALKARVKKE